MPRGEGLTYEQVAAAADLLVAQGQSATARAVRAAIGGSTNTIVRHLQAWRTQRPQPVAAATLDMPASIVRAYLEEVTRVAAESRAEVEAQLVEVKMEAGDLARAADEFERERDALGEQLSELTSERDTLAGKAAVQLTELEQLRAELERERRAVEEARIAIAQERLAAEGQRAQLEAQRSELVELRAAVRSEHDARVDAQREQAALGAAKAALLDRLTETQARERSALDEVEGLRARVEVLVGTERACASDLARLQQELAAVREGEKRARDERKQARAALERARQEAEQQAGLLERTRAELAAAKQEVATLATARQELEHCRQKLQEAALENARLTGRLDALERSGERDEPQEAPP